jgi:hypothetical protein
VHQKKLRFVVWMYNLQYLVGIYYRFHVKEAEALQSGSHLWKGS